MTVVRGATTRCAPAVVGLVLLLAGCAPVTPPDTSTAAPPVERAVVLVSGGALVTPFTTPTQACKDGGGFLAAGNTNTELRKYLLAAGKQVYTAPVMNAWGPVREQPDSLGPFADCLAPLPESMTITSTGDLNAGGERLVRFLGHLNSEYGITDVDLVGHSNGGLWSRAAITVLKATNSPITVRSLTTIATPHVGATPPRYFAGEIDLAACMGNTYCESSVKAWGGLVGTMDKGLSAEDTVRFLSGPTGWNAAQGNALEGIPVTLLAGTYFEEPDGDPALWPYDGTVSRFSAWASDVSDSIIPWRTCWKAPLVHSIYQSQELGIPWDTAITNNAAAIARVAQAIDGADTALQQPDRQGCQA